MSASLTNFKIFLLLVVEEVEPYVANSEWLNAIGVPWLTFIERN